MSNFNSSEIPNSSDCISRQAAIEAISTWDKYGVDERGRVVRWYEGLEPYVHLRDVVTAILNTPSAQPEQKIGKFVRWMEKRETPDYISYTPHCKCSLCGNELLIESINYCYMCGASLIEDREVERKEE